MRYLFLAALLALLAALDAFHPGLAQSVQAQQVLRNNPNIRGLPGYVSSWETNMNRRMWEQTNYGTPLEPPPEAPILYKNRAGQQVDQKEFLLDTLRHQQNLP